MYLYVTGYICTQSRDPGRSIILVILKSFSNNEYYVENDFYFIYRWNHVFLQCSRSCPVGIISIYVIGPNTVSDFLGCSCLLFDFFFFYQIMCDVGKFTLQWNRVRNSHVSKTGACVYSASRYSYFPPFTLDSVAENCDLLYRYIVFFRSTDWQAISWQRRWRWMPNRCCCTEC